MAVQFNTKRDKILFYFDKYAKNQSQEEALENTKNALSDIGNGYITEVVKKNRFDGLEPRTPLQKAVVDVFKQHPDWTYSKIAKKAGEKLGEEPPSTSSVSDYVQLFCGEKRRNPESYTISDKFKQSIEERDNGHRASNGDISIPGDSKPLNEEDHKIEEYEEGEEGEENEDGVLGDLSDDEIFSIIRSLIHSDEDELARKVMSSYKLE